MAESNTEIANLALSHLAVGKEIANLESENTDEANAIRRIYETCRRATLRDFNWPFARKFAVLGLVDENPSEIDEEWDYSYRYPSDCLKMRRIIAGKTAGNETRQDRIPYVVGRDDSGKLVYTNQSSAQAEYTFNETDESRMDDDFVLAFSLRLSAFAAPRITGGDPFKLGPQAFNLYLQHLGIARASSVNEQQDPEEPDSELIRSRE